MKVKTVPVYIVVYDDMSNGVKVGSVFSKESDARVALKETAKEDADYYDIPFADIEIDEDSYYIEDKGEFLASGYIEHHWMEVE